MAPGLQHQPPRVFLLRWTLDLGRRLHHAHFHEAQLGDVPLHLVLDLFTLAQGVEVLRRSIGARSVRAETPGAGAPRTADGLVPWRRRDPWPAVHASLPTPPGSPPARIPRVPRRGCQQTGGSPVQQNLKMKMSEDAFRVSPQHWISVILTPCMEVQGEIGEERRRAVIGRDWRRKCRSLRVLDNKVSDKAQNPSARLVETPRTHAGPQWHPCPSRSRTHWPAHASRAGLRLPPDPHASPRRCPWEARKSP